VEDGITQQPNPVDGHEDENRFRAAWAQSPPSDHPGTIRLSHCSTTDYRIYNNFATQIDLPDVGE
jgi:hypothetical protein